MPAAQSRHELTEVLAGEGLYVPAIQLVQDPEPALLQVPDAQGKQALMEVLLVSELYVPAEHDRQSPGESFPVDGLYVPCAWKRWVGEGQQGTGTKWKGIDAPQDRRGTR